MIVEIINWKEFKEQFGLYSTDTHKGAIQISQELMVRCNKEPKHVLNHIFHIFIDYELNNVDSGFCTFKFDKTEGDNYFFEYLGTTK